jgi:hypothetical protein
MAGTKPGHDETGFVLLVGLSASEIVVCQGLAARPRHQH